MKIEEIMDHLADLTTSIIVIKEFNEILPRNSPLLKSNNEMIQKLDKIRLALLDVVNEWENYDYYE